MTTAEVEAALAMLRRQNVAKYTDTAGGGFSVEFFAPPIEMAPERAKHLSEKCLCGHEHFEHNMEAGLCLKGCDPTLCAGPEKSA